MAIDSNIRITLEPPANFEAVQGLYEALGWNSLGLSVEDLDKMCRQSWYVVYAYEGEQLVGMGRIISDGVITGIICGLGIRPDHQQAGIGKRLMQLMISHCETYGVIPQLMCTESLEPYYESMGFRKFAIGMTRNRIEP